MKRPLVAIAIALTVLGVGGVALAKTYQFKSKPAGEFEVPAVSTSAEGVLKLKVERDGKPVVGYLDEKDVVMVPIASLEQHGPHLPLLTDTIQAE